MGAPRMMPGNVLSTVPVRARFAGAAGLGVTSTVDYCDGGIAIQDASEGLLYQRWRARLFDAGKLTSHVLLDARNTPEFQLFAAPGMVQISIAFDQNMRPALAYVDGAGSHLSWYDSTIPGMTVIGVNGTTPRIAMDDPRLLGSNGYQTNDIILGYKRDGRLYYRQQRDRFGEEFDPTEDLPEPQRTEQRALIAASGGLIKIGMNRQLRLQFMMEIT